MDIIRKNILEDFIKRIYQKNILEEYFKIYFL